MSSQPMLEEWNLQVLMLVQALVDAISANFRMTALLQDGGGWILRFYLGRDNGEDVEEIEDAVCQCMVHQDSSLRCRSELIMGREHLPGPSEADRVVYRRREPFDIQLGQKVAPVQKVLPIKMDLILSSCLRRLQMTTYPRSMQLNSKSLLTLRIKGTDLLSLLQFFKQGGSSIDAIRRLRGAWARASGLPNYPLHMVQWGHSRQIVFAEDEDYQCYLSNRRDLKGVFDNKPHTSCQMITHIHLFLMTCRSFFLPLPPHSAPMYQYAGDRRLPLNG